jgi:nucleoside-diphosphate-sugar epimerase
MYENKEIYISGSTGQLGKALRVVLKKKNVKVKILSRTIQMHYSNEELLKYNLGDSIDFKNSNKEIIFFHFAYDGDDSKKLANNINYKGLKQILKSLDRVELKRFIFISTPNLNKNTTTYNAQKELAENLLRNYDSLILRPSLIYSKKEGINKIFNKIKKINFIKIPIPKNKNKISPIDIDKFIDLIIQLSFNKYHKETYLIKGKVDMTFKDFLQKFHNISTYYAPNIFWKIIIKILSFFLFKKTFYLSERVLGLIFLKDISDLSRSIKFIEL